jgi:hypothetical protein
VDVSEAEDEIDIQEVIDNLKNLEEQRREIGSQMKPYLTELGFKT